LTCPRHTLVQYEPCTQHSTEHRRALGQVHAQSTTYDWRPLLISPEEEETRHIIKNSLNISEHFLENRKMRARARVYVCVWVWVCVCVCTRVRARECVCLRVIRSLNGSRYKYGLPKISEQS
jgi:hypothetical protein